MTDDQDKETGRFAAGNTAALSHGVYHYLVSGELPADLKGLDAEIAAEVLKAVGGDDKFRLMAMTTARAFVVNEMLYQHFVKEHKQDPNKIPGSLKFYGSFQESLRRCLIELGLTPASALKVKTDESITAGEILDLVKPDGK